MKKIFILIAVTALLLTSGCSQALPEFESYPPQATLDAQSGFKQWSTNDHSMIITYPHTWFASQNSAIVQLITPLGDATPQYREYIVFGAMQPNEGDTAQTVADAAWNDMKEMFPDLELIKNEEVTQAGYVMQLRAFSGHVNNEMVGPEGNYVWYQYSFIASGLSYSITFSSTEEMFQTYKKDFDFILDKLELYL